MRFPEFGRLADKLKPLPEMPQITRLFDDITKAASKKAEPIICNAVLMNAGRRTQASMAIALALQYQLKDALA